MSFDPIARYYPELTPYQFASNTPIESIDLDGLERSNSTHAEHAETFRTNAPSIFDFEFEVKVGIGWGIGIDARLGPAKVGILMQGETLYGGYNSQTGNVYNASSGFELNLGVASGGWSDKTLLASDSEKPLGVNVQKHESFIGLLNGKSVGGQKYETVTTTFEDYQSIITPENRIYGPLGLNQFFGELENYNNNNVLYGQSETESSTSREGGVGFGFQFGVAFSIEAKLKTEISKTGTKITENKSASGEINVGVPNLITAPTKYAEGKREGNLVIPR